MLNISREVEFVRVLDAQTVAGNATKASGVVDLAGFEAVAFVIVAGTLGAAGITAVAQRDANDAIGFADAEALDDTTITLADADDDLMAIIDIAKPQQRYVRVSLTAGANDCGIDGVVAIKYRARSAEVAQGATVADAAMVVTPGVTP